MADVAVVGDADEQGGEAEAGGARPLVRVALRPQRLEAVLSRRLAELQEVEHELAVVHAELERVARVGLRHVRVEGVRRLENTQVVEGLLPERGEPVDVEARELQRVGHRLDARRKTELREIEAGRERMRSCCGSTRSAR